MRIFGWAADEGGCCHYRIAEPLKALGERGHQVHHHTVMPPDWLRDADVIIGQRVCLPGPTRAWQQLAKQGRTLVYEIDDNLLHVDHRNPAWSFYSQPQIRENLLANVQAASRVTVSTEPLAEVMRRYNDDVRVAPNSIPDWLLSWERPKHERLTIGWAGSATHEMDFEEVRGPLRQFLNRHPEVRFHVMGTDYARWMRLPAAQCDFTPWIPTVEDYLKTIDFDIAIAPLRPHPFNRSKSHIKVLEAAALGIPVVASSVHPYERFVRHGETGFLVRRDHEWGRFLRDLVNDEAMRTEMGAKARQQTADWTTSKTAHLWEQALTDQSFSYA